MDYYLCHIRRINRLATRLFSTPSKIALQVVATGFIIIIMVKSFNRNGAELIIY